MQVQRSSLLTEFIPPKASQSLDRMEEDSDLDGAGPSEVVPKKEVTGMYFFTPPPTPITTTTLPNPTQCFLTKQQRVLEVN